MVASRVTKLFSAILLLLFLAALAEAEEIIEHRKRYDLVLVPVTVTRVIDGDTFVVAMPDGKEERVRLLCIDTPERGEEGFHEAKEELRQRIEGHDVKLKIKKYHKRGNYLRDRYRRLLAELREKLPDHCRKH